LSLHHISRFRALGNGLLARLRQLGHDDTAMFRMRPAHDQASAFEISTEGYMTTPVGPDFIALQVRSLATSSKFYMEVFGFEAAAQSPPGAAVLKTAPIPLALREPLRPLLETGPLGVGMVLWIACDDASALHDLIVKRGGAILSPLADGPFGRFFVAGDPDGYAITFHTAQS
jgi:predicted enzyme related to lactoylglutathione lyase